MVSQIKRINRPADLNTIITGLLHQHLTKFVKKQKLEKRYYEMEEIGKILPQQLNHLAAIINSYENTFETLLQGYY